MANVPDEQVQSALVAPSAIITRRVEIYEQDAETPWKRDIWDRILVAGTVSIDYDRDERRNMDIELDNHDGLLDPVAGGLWYDKVFKLYYGVVLRERPRPVRAVIVEESSAPGQAEALSKLLADGGIKFVRFSPDAVRYDQIKDYDVVISISSATTQKYALLMEAHNNGKAVMSFAMSNTAAQMPYIIANAGATTVTDTATVTFTPNSSSMSTLINGWDSYTMISTGAFRKMLAFAADCDIISTKYDANNGVTFNSIARNTIGEAKWIHVQAYQFKREAFQNDAGYQNAANLYGRMVTWLNGFVARDKWEMQIGEFLADGISDSDSLGDRIKIVGRDLTKRCLNSKFVTATTFAKTMYIEDVIKAVASNAGIKKFSLPVTLKTLDKEMTWERGTTRWAVIKEIATANNYEVYFDAQGRLTMREFRDPALTPPTLVLTTGIGGNLVSRGAKTSDSKLFNHIVVVGESSDSTIPPVYAEAINDNPGSSSNRDEIGDRVDIVTSSLVTEITQAQELANSLLAVSSLEEFELQFSSTPLPYIEAGEILEMSDPDSQYWGPDRYLLSSLTFPLDLSPMSGTGKRVIKVK